MTLSVAVLSMVLCAARVEGQGQIPAATAPPVVPSSSAPSSFTLRPGDIVRLKIWREPELSGDYAVDEAGRINFPLIGLLSVSEETTESLHNRLVAAYRQSVQNLSMGVIFLRRIPVVGAVRVPGLYPVDPTMTVGDAIAMAGGATTDPSHTQISLLRSGRVFRSSIDPSLRISLLETQPGDQLYVPAMEGFFARNPWAPGAIAQSLIAIVTVLITTHR